MRSFKSLALCEKTINIIKINEYNKYKAVWNLMPCMGKRREWGALALKKYLLYHTNMMKIMDKDSCKKKELFVLHSGHK